MIQWLKEKSDAKITFDNDDVFSIQEKSLGEEGEGKITFTSIEEDKITATFSGVIHNKNGQRATVEG